MTAPLCFLDTETDGVHPDRKVWEIAAIRREPDGRETTFEAFVEIDLSTADPFGLRVGGFYDRHPTGIEIRDGFAPSGSGNAAVPMTTVRAARRIAHLTHRAHVVGAVPNFDTEVLAGFLRRERLTPSWHYHLCDVENLAVGYLAGKGQQIPPPWDSDAITAALGIDPVPDDERHTALGDVRWAMRIYDAVMTSQETA